MRLGALARGLLRRVVIGAAALAATSAATAALTTGYGGRADDAARPERIGEVAVISPGAAEVRMASAAGPESYSLLNARSTCFPPRPARPLAALALSLGVAVRVRMRTATGSAPRRMS